MFGDIRNTVDFIWHKYKNSYYSVFIGNYPLPEAVLVIIEK